MLCATSAVVARFKVCERRVKIASSQFTPRWKTGSHQNTSKRDTPARVEHRASLHLQTQAQELPEFRLQWQMKRLHGSMKQATRLPLQYLEILRAGSIQEIARCRVQGARRGRPR